MQRAQWNLIEKGLGRDLIRLSGKDSRHENQGGTRAAAVGFLQS